MITDPLFIFGILGMILCLYSWIKFNINEELKESIVVKNISTISFISGAFVLMSIFTNSGDLGIVLFFGSIVSLLVMLFGFFLKNKNMNIINKIEDKKIENRLLEKELALLDNDIRYITILARKNLGMIKHGEKIYRFNN